jgi:hypothetical protein
VDECKPLVMGDYDDLIIARHDKDTEVGRCRLTL